MRGRTLPADGRTMLFTAYRRPERDASECLHCVAMRFAELHRDASANRPTGSNWQTSGPPPFVRLRSERASDGKPSFAHLSLRPCGNSELVSRRARGVHRSCGAAKVDGKAAHIPTDSTAARQLPSFAAKMPGTVRSERMWQVSRERRRQSADICTAAFEIDVTSFCLRPARLRLAQPSPPSAR